MKVNPGYLAYFDEPKIANMKANFADAQKTVAQRARENGLAALGQWQKTA